METVPNLKDILEFGREDKPFRDVQVDFLKWYQENFDKYKIVVVEGPTAVGKSLIASTAGSYLAYRHFPTSLITSTVVLQDQYASEYEYLPILKGASRYPCHQGADNQSCWDFKEANETYCDGIDGADCPCIYKVARLDAAHGSLAIFNFYSYFVNRMYKKALIIDEAHNVIKLLRDLFDVKLWQCELGYNENEQIDANFVKTMVGRLVADLRQDLVEAESQNHSPKTIENLKDQITKYSMILEKIGKFFESLIIVKKEDTYRGRMKECRGTKQPYIHIKSLQIDQLGKELLWPDSVERIILMSATIKEVDVKTLGLTNKEVGYYKCPSPIPVPRRPFYFMPVARTTSKYRNESRPKIAQAIREIASVYPKDKGIVHTIYSEARELKKIFEGDSRFIFHDEKNKEEKLQEYLQSKEPKVLFACGLSEGLDLADDKGRFQIIAGLMFPELGDPVNEWLSKNDQQQYYWETIRTIVQQTGRICRNPNDFGVTFMISSDFEWFWAATRGMWPDWFVPSKINVNYEAFKAKYVKGPA